MQETLAAQEKKKKRSRLVLTMTGGALLLLVVLLALDLTIMMLGYQLNDRICLAACRAAAKQPSAQKALTQAGDAVRNLNLGIMSQFVSTDILTDSANFIYQDKQDKGQIRSVTVTTESKVRLPLPVLCLEVETGKAESKKDSAVILRKRCTMPLQNQAEPATKAAHLSDTATYQP